MECSIVFRRQDTSPKARRRFPSSFPPHDTLPPETHTHTHTTQHNPPIPPPPKKKQLHRLPWMATTGATLAGKAPFGHTPLATLVSDDVDAATRPLMVEVGPMEIRTFEVELVVPVGGMGAGGVVEVEEEKGGVDALLAGEKGEGGRGGWTMME
jgi:hypothetical protein